LPARARFAPKNIKSFIYHVTKRDLGGNILRNTSSISATRVNKEGFPSFSQPLELMIVQNLTCNIIEPTFYDTQGAALQQSLNLYKQAINECPDFLAKAATCARNNGFMRLQPIIAAVFLSTKFPKNKFERVFNRVVLTPKDLFDFMLLCKNVFGVRKGLGRKIKSVIKRWLSNNLSEYWAIKYRKELKIATKLVHVSREEMNDKYNIVAWLHKFSRQDEAVAAEMLSKMPKIKQYEMLKRASDEEEVLKLIKGGQIPHEVATSIVKPDARIWEAMIKQMPYFALLRHLNALNKNGVFNDSNNIGYIVDRLTDVNAMEKAKILPFRLFTAWKVASSNGVPARILNALAIALEKSFVNMPEITGKVIVGIDVSGSMTTRVRKAKYRFIEIAAIFGAALAKKCKDVTLIPFDHQEHEFDHRSHGKIMGIVDYLSAIRGGGTDLAIPVKAMIDRGIKADVLLEITDNEEWIYHGVMACLKEYRDSVNPDLQAFLLRIDPYINDSALDLSDPRNHVISGWSDSVLGFINLVLNGNTVTDEIKKRGDA